MTRKRSGLIAACRCGDGPDGGIGGPRVWELKKYILPYSPLLEGQQRPFLNSSCTEI